MLKIESVMVGVVSTNCYIVTDTDTREAVVIDPGDRADLILQRLRSSGSEVVQHIFLTHGHFDHSLAMPELRRALGAKCMIHTLDAGGLTDASLGSPHRGKIAGEPADILVEEGDAIGLGMYTFQVIHTPGHTPGSACLRVRLPYMERGLLFTGDTLFEDDCGRCDLPGGDYGAMLRSLRKLAALDGDYTVYPGHDVATTLERERSKNVNMLEALAEEPAR